MTILPSPSGRGYSPRTTQLEHTSNAGPASSASHGAAAAAAWSIKVFVAADKNGDGSVTKTEIKKYARTHEPPSLLAPF